MKIKNAEFGVFDLKVYNRILKQGLSCGLGLQDSKMCIEAAVCQSLGLDHDDNPPCVAPVVRNFKIDLNDQYWSSDMARSRAMYQLGIAQLGSKENIDEEAFVTEIQFASVTQLLPHVLSLCHSENSFKDYKQLASKARKANRSNMADVMEELSSLIHDSQPVWPGDIEHSESILSAISELNVLTGCTDSTPLELAFAMHTQEQSNTSNKYLIWAADTMLAALKKVKSPGVAYLAKTKAKTPAWVKLGKAQKLN